MQSDLSKPAPQRTRGKRRPVPATQGSDVYQHDGNSGDGGELLGFSPTDLEILSTPTAETNNQGQEIMDGAEDLLPGDVENLSERGEDTLVIADYFPSDSETDQETLLQQEPVGSHYPVRNQHPPNILCHDRLGNPSYHPISTLSTSATNANVKTFCLFTIVACDTFQSFSHSQSLDDTLLYSSVLSFCTICGPKHSPVCASDDCSGKLHDCLS